MPKAKLTQAKAVIMGSTITAVVGGLLAIVASILATTIPIKLAIRASQTAAESATLQAATNQLATSPMGNEGGSLGGTLEPPLPKIRLDPSTLEYVTPNAEPGSPLRIDVDRDTYGDPFDVGDIYLGAPKINRTTDSFKEINISLDHRIQVYDPGLEQELTPTRLRTCEISASDDLILGVASLAKEEWIRFENVPLFRITDLKPISFPSIPHVIYQENAGAGSYGGKYEILLNSTSVQQVPQRTTVSPNTKLPDFFTLQPGEEEWLELNTYCLEPGQYEIEVGIDYFYQGMHGRAWSTPINLFALDNYYYWGRQIQPGPIPALYDFFGYIQWDPKTHSRILSFSPITQWLVP